METFITGLSSADEEVQLQAVKAAKLLLMEDRDDSSIQSDVEILVLAVVPKLLDFLGYSDKYELRVASIAVLRKIAWYSIEKGVIVNHSVLVPLMAFLKSPDLDVVLAVLKALGNVSLVEGDLPYRIMGEGVIDPLLDLMSNSDITAGDLHGELINTLSYLYNEHQKTDGPALDISLAKQLLSEMKNLVRLNDDEILGNVCCALINLWTNDESKEIIESISKETDVVPRLMELINTPENTKWLVWSLYMLMIIISDKQDEQSHADTTRIVDRLIDVVKSPYTNITIDAVIGLSSMIYYGGVKLRDYVIGTGAIALIVDLIHNNSKKNLMAGIGFFKSLTYPDEPYLPMSVVRQLLPTLKRLIRLDDDDIFANVCEALFYLARIEVNAYIKITEVLKILRQQIIKLMSTNSADVSPKLLSDAVYLLWELTCDDNSEVKQAVVETGFLALLVELLTYPHLDVVKRALWTLNNIADDGLELRDRIINEGALLPLVNIIQSNPEVALLQRVVWFLLSLSYHPLGLPVLRQFLPALVHLFIIDKEDIITRVIQILFNMTANEDEESINEICNDSVILPRVIELISSRSNRKDKCDIIEILSNITAGTAQHTKAVLDAGAVAPLVALLVSPDSNIVCQVIQTLSNVLFDEPKLRDYFIDEGVITTLLDFVKASPNERLIRAVSRFLKNVCYHQDPPLPISVVNQILPKLNVLINFNNDSTQEYAGLAFANLMRQKKGENFQRVMDSSAGLLPRLIQLLDSDDEAVMVSALSVVSLITKYASETAAQLLFEHKAMKPLLRILTTGYMDCRKVAAEVITRVAQVGDLEHIIKLWNLGVVAPMCAFFLTIDDPLEILNLLKGLVIILREVEDENDLNSLFMSSGINCFPAVVRHINTLQHHVDSDIQRISTIVLRQLQFSTSSSF